VRPRLSLIAGEEPIARPLALRQTIEQRQGASLQGSAKRILGGGSALGAPYGL